MRKTRNCTCASASNRCCPSTGLGAGGCSNGRRGEPSVVGMPFELGIRASQGALAIDIHMPGEIGGSEKKIAEGKYIRNTQVLKTDLVKLETQMQRTVGMYNQIKVHRDRLKDDNVSLRHEMEGIHSKMSKKSSPSINKGGIGDDVGRKVEGGAQQQNI